MSEFYTYLYIDPSRQEPIYVGKGKGRRASVHLRRKDMHPFTHRLQTMRRNGVAPEVRYIAEGVDEELAHLVEEEAIAKWGRRDLGNGPLLNLTDGGEGSSGWLMSEETKAKIAEKARGRKLSDDHRSKIANGVRGRIGPNVRRVFDQEVREKMSQAKRGMKWPTLECPHCHFTSSSNAMKRWHFDNCKVR